MAKKIVIVGSGVAGVNAATKLVDNGYDGSLITIIDMGNSSSRCSMTNASSTDSSIWSYSFY